MNRSFVPPENHLSLDRRQAIQLAGAISLTSLFDQGCAISDAGATCALPYEEYAQHDALGLAQLVQKKDFKPEELLETAIARAEAINPKINAIVVKLYDEARAAIGRGLPDGPFRGVPFLVKDLLCQMKGVECSNSSRLLKGYVPDHDDTVVRRYRESGLVIFGRTHTPECGLTAVTDSALHGIITRNPWNLARTPGGSSDGTGAAVAAGIVPMGSGNDGGGSIRIPASCCGLFGMKPTRSRVSLGPDRYESVDGLVVAHALTRSVRDSAALLDATAGPEPGDPIPELRKECFLEEVKVDPGRLQIALAVKAAPDQQIAPECVKAAEEAAKLCERLGHHVEDVSDELQQHLPWIELRDAWHTSLETNISAWIHSLLQQRQQELRDDDVEPVTREIIERGRRHTAFDLIAARALFHRAGRLIAEFQMKYDVILTPTLGQPPVPAEKPTQSLSGNYDDYVAGLAAFQPFTPLANITGQPAMSVPLHWTADGLPVGVQFFGRFGDEATLFRLAAQLEKAQPWANKRPCI